MKQQLIKNRLTDIRKKRKALKRAGKPYHYPVKRLDKELMKLSYSELKKAI